MASLRTAAPLEPSATPRPHTAARGTDLATIWPVQPVKRRLRAIYQVVRATYQGWSDDKASGLSAALAYYTVFALAPLFIIAVAIAGALFDQAVAREAVLSEVRSLIGESGVVTLRAMMHAASKPGDSVVATIIGSVTLLIGATSVFAHLQEALNTIWKVDEKQVATRASIMRFLLRRVLSFGMVLALGFLLVVSLVASAVIAGTGDVIFGALPAWTAQVANQLLALALTTALFALMFKVLPDVRIAWRDVWVGALLTSTMLGVGRYLIGLYLGRSSVASAYGAAGALVLMLVWIYYSANILFLGAEMTHVMARRRRLDSPPAAAAANIATA